MVQVPLVKVPAQAGVWVEAKVEVEAEWADHLQQGRAEVASVRTVEQRSLILPGRLAIKKAARSVGRK